MIKHPMRSILLVVALTAAGAAHAERSGEQIVKQQCASCHQTGVNGAPKIDDRAAWVPRMKQGVNATVRSAARGHGKMPARGGMADLTDTELRAAILYMFYPGGAALKDRPAASPAARDPNHKVVDGTEIFLGIMTAESLAAQGVKTPGKGYYHVNISLRDNATHAEIKDAQVEARVANPMGGQTRKLDPMTVNNASSYGNFFRMSGNDPYVITVSVRRPQHSQPLEAKFDFKR